MSGTAPSGEVRHVPVLPAEVLQVLALMPGQTVVDATLGVGGHARLVLERLQPDGRLIGIDRDPAMLARAGPRLEIVRGAAVVTLVEANFDRLREVLEELNVDRVDAVLADLGFCSDQLEDQERGLSFQWEGSLDMRLNPAEGAPASALLRQLNERDLADLIWKYGEERFSRRIARRIVETRRLQPLETTTQLADLVRRCVPRSRGGRPSIDPATRTFQALRIAVNDELGALERLLAVLPSCLMPGGRAAFISFHSLEDRLVKQAFRDREKWTALTPKPIQAGEEEVRDNPRARSAKLRAATLGPRLAGRHRRAWGPRSPEAAGSGD